MPTTWHSTGPRAEWSSRSTPTVTARHRWSGVGSSLPSRLTALVPEPIAADLESVWFGRPAIVMSRLPGRPNVTPKDADSWVAALAQALTQLHETVLDGAGGALTPSPPIDTWHPPAGEHDPL